MQNHGQNRSRNSQSPANFIDKHGVNSAPFALQARNRHRRRLHVTNATKSPSQLTRSAPSLRVLITKKGKSQHIERAQASPTGIALPLPRSSRPCDTLPAGGPPCPRTHRPKPLSAPLSQPLAGPSPAPKPQTRGGARRPRCAGSLPSCRFPCLPPALTHPSRTTRSVVAVRSRRGAVAGLGTPRLGGPGDGAVFLVREGLGVTGRREGVVVDGRGLGANA
jgi:hypothetical protein